MLFRSYNWAKKGGHLKTEDYNDFELSEFIMELPTISSDEIMEFYEKAHKIFYGRPKMIWRRLLKINNIHHLKDTFMAFCYIMLRYKMGTRGDVRKDWVALNMQDYFNYDLMDEQSVFMTAESSQVKLKEQKLVEHSTP